VVLCDFEFLQKYSLPDMVYTDVGRLSSGQNALSIRRVLNGGEITYRESSFYTKLM